MNIKTGIKRIIRFNYLYILPIVLGSLVIFSFAHCSDEPAQEDETAKREVTKEKLPPPPTPAVPAVEKEMTYKGEEVYKRVEQMPRFPGCEDLQHDQRRACANKKLLDFVHENVSYTEAARQAKYQGMVLVSFIVDKKGNIDNIEVSQDPGYGLGDECLRVVKQLNGMEEKWIPGKQDGIPVNVRFNLPVRFKLD